MHHTPDDQKFLVSTSELEVKVLGTKFNINDHRAKTTVVLKDTSLGQKKFKRIVPSHDLDILLKGLSESSNIK